MLQAEIVPFRTDPRIIEVEAETVPDSPPETEAPGTSRKLPAARTGPRFANGDAGPLADPRHEKFAQAFAMTSNASQSYRASGFGGASVEVLGGRFARHPVILARVDEIRREMGAASEVSKVAAVGWLHRVMVGLEAVEPQQLAAANLLGKWLGFESGTKSETAVAEGLSAVLKEVRSR